MCETFNRWDAHARTLESRRRVSRAAAAALKTAVRLSRVVDDQAGGPPPSMLFRGLPGGGRMKFPGGEELAVINMDYRRHR